MDRCSCSVCTAVALYVSVSFACLLCWQRVSTEAHRCTCSRVPLSVQIKNSIFLGETANIGNPTMCDVPSNTFAGCKPLYGSGLCDLPIPPSKVIGPTNLVC